MLSEEGEESRAQHARLLQDVEGPEGDNNELSYMRGVDEGCLGLVCVSFKTLNCKPENILFNFRKFRFRLLRGERLYKCCGRMGG